MNEYSTEEYRGCTITWYYDTDAESPRNWCNIAEMICFGKYSFVGDKHNYKCLMEYLRQLCIETLEPSVCDKIDFEEASVISIIKMLSDTVLIRPMFVFDHGGIVVHSRSFADRWDTSWVGVCAVKRSNLITLSGEDWKNLAVASIEAEMDVLNDYLMGNVFGYVVEEDETGGKIDSCWGFIGEDSMDEQMDEIKGNIDAHIEDVRSPKARIDGYIQLELNFAS